jgi:hypothetical protein
VVLDEEAFCGALLKLDHRPNDTAADTLNRQLSLWVGFGKVALLDLE